MLIDGEPILDEALWAVLELLLPPDPRRLRGTRAAAESLKTVELPLMIAW